MLSVGHIRWIFRPFQVKFARIVFEQLHVNLAPISKFLPLAEQTPTENSFTPEVIDITYARV